jgi:hypothetical protein
MNFTKSHLWFTLASLACSSLFAQKAEEPLFQTFVTPQVVHSDFLDVNGKAAVRIAVLIDEMGKVDDWIALETDDQPLVSAISRVIGDWRFTPRSLNGQTSWSYRELTLNFAQQGGIVTLTPLTAAQKFYGTLNESTRLAIPYVELGKEPKIKNAQAPAVPRDWVGQRQQLNVSIEYFIDAEGKVRMPMVQSSNADDRVTALIMEALMRWEYEPATFRGRQVATKVVTPFVLN